MKTNFRAFALAFNSVRRLSRALIGIASNAEVVPAITDETDGWLMLAPYGDIDYFHEEKPGEWKKYTQSFQQPQATAMAAAFNSLSRKKGASFKGLPVFSGHPDVDPKRWPDERRLGGVIGLEARANGIFAKVAWNDLGAKNRAEGYLVYPSPSWLYDEQRAATSGRIEPDELRSVGLTNTPRIKDSIPWVNSDDPDAPESSAAAGAPTESQSASNNPATMLDHKKLLTGLLGLKDDASDDDIQSAHDAHMDVKDAKDKLEKAHGKLTKAYDKHSEAMQALESQKAAANSERDTARADAEKFRRLAAGTLLDTAVNAGRITAAERPALETAFNSDFDAASATLAGKKVALNTQTLGLRPGAVGVDLTNPESRRMAFNVRVDQLTRDGRASNPRYGMDDAIREMRANPEDAALLKAMEPAAKA